MEVEFLVDLLPGLIVDMLPPMDAMNTVVTEVISQQQTRPWLAATVMAKVLSCFPYSCLFFFRLLSC